MLLLIFAADHARRARHRVRRPRRLAHRRHRSSRSRRCGSRPTSSTRRPGRADPHPARQTSGHSRSQRKIGVARHGLGEHLLATRPSSCSARSRSPTRSRRPASRCTSATPACSTSAWPASWPSAATATPSRSSASACPWWVGMLIGLLAAAVFALILGIPTLRLRADYLAIVTIAAAEIVRLLFTTQVFDDVHQLGRRPRRLPRGLPRARTRSPRAPTASVRGTYNDERAAGCACSASSLLAIAVLRRLGAHAQPVGPRAQGHPRRRGRRALARQERLRVQDAGARPRWRHRRARRHRLRRSPRRSSPAATPTSLTFFLWTILLLGGAATVFGPSLGA